MKKYFSLFTIAFAMHFISTPLPSHAMDDQEAECWAKKGDIILLEGTSSSGKTTTTRQLKIKCPKFEINGRDEIMKQVEKFRKYVPENPEKETPDEYDSSKDKYYLNHLAQWVVKHQDKPLILDVLTSQPIIDALKKINFSCAPFKVLLYVPLVDYRTRLQKRNEKAFQENNFEDLRFPLDMVFQYVTIFKVSDQDAIPPLGMRINEKEMREILNGFSQDVVKFLKSVLKSNYPKKNEEELKKEIENEEARQLEIQKILNKMFSSIKEGYLVPKDDYDFIIDTSVVSPPEVAQKIQETFLEKKRKDIIN